MVRAEGGLACAPIAAINAKLNDTPMSLLAMDCAAERVDQLIEPDGPWVH